MENEYLRQFVSDIEQRDRAGKPSSVTSGGYNDVPAVPQFIPHFFGSGFLQVQISGQG